MVCIVVRKHTKEWVLQAIRIPSQVNKNITTRNKQIKMQFGYKLMSRYFIYNISDENNLHTQTLYSAMDSINRLYMFSQLNYII